MEKSILMYLINNFDEVECEDEDDECDEDIDKSDIFYLSGYLNKVATFCLNIYTIII